MDKSSQDKMNSKPSELENEDESTNDEFPDHESLVSNEDNNISGDEDRPTDMIHFGGHRSNGVGSSASSAGSKITVSEVLIELDDNLKSKLINDLMQICEVDEDTAKGTLQNYRWSMQV